MTDFEVAVPFLGDAISCLLVPKNKTNQNTKWHKMYVCSLQMPFFFRLTRFVMWHPIKINLHEFGLEGAGLGLLWRVSSCWKPAGSEKASVTESAQACVGSGLARGAGGEPEARKRYDGELSGEIESQDTQPNNNAMPFGERERESCERYAWGVSQVVSSLDLHKQARQRKKCAAAEYSKVYGHEDFSMFPSHSSRQTAQINGTGRLGY